MEDGRCLLDVISDADALTNFLDAELCRDEQAFSAEDLQGALPDTFAWSPPSSPTSFLPPTSSSLENIVDGDVGSFQGLEAGGIAATTTSSGVSKAASASLEFQGQDVSMASTTTPVAVSATNLPAPVTTVHHHGGGSGLVVSGQEGSGVGTMVPSIPTPAEVTTSTAQSSARTDSPSSSLPGGFQQQDFDQHQLKQLQLQLQQLKQQEAQLLLQQQQAMLSRQQQQKPHPQQVQTTALVGQVPQQQLPQQPQQQVVVGSSGLQIIPQAALLQQGQVSQINQLSQVNQINSLGQYAQIGQINQPTQIANVSSSPQPPKAPTPVPATPVQVQPQKQGVVYAASQGQTIAMAQQQQQEQQQQVFTFTQQMQQQQQTVSNFGPNATPAVALAQGLPQQQLAQLAQQQLLQQQQQQQQPQQQPQQQQQQPQLLPQTVTLGTSQAGQQQLQNNLLLSAVRPPGSLPAGMSLQGTIIQTANGNRILLQAPQMVAGQLGGQITNLQPGMPFQPPTVATTAAPVTHTTSQPANVATVGGSGSKPMAVNQQPTVFNIAGGQPGQQQQIVIQRTPGPNGTQNQNIFLRTVPSNVIQFQGSVVSGAPTTTSTSTLPGQSAGGQVVLSQGQVAALGQPHMLGGLNMVNNAHSININVLPAPLQNLQGIQQAVQGTATLPGSVNIQPKPTVTVSTQPTMQTTLVSQAASAPSIATAATTLVPAHQQQQLHLTDGNLKLNAPTTSGMSVATQQLTVQQLQSLGLLPANFGQGQNLQTPASSGAVTAPQSTVNNSVAQVIQTVTATAAKQVSNVPTCQPMSTMVLANPKGLQAPQNPPTLQTVPQQPGAPVGASVALTTPSSGQQPHHALSNLQPGHQVVIGPAGTGQVHNVGQLPLLKPKTEPRSTPSPQIPQQPTPPPSAITPIVNLTAPMGTPAPVSAVTQASSVYQAGNIPTVVTTATVSSGQVNPRPPTPGRNRTSASATIASSAAGLQVKSVGVGPMGLQNIQNVSAPPNVNIQNMPQLQVKNLGQMPATSSLTPATQSAAVTTTVATINAGGTNIPIRPKTSQLAQHRKQQQALKAQKQLQQQQQQQLQQQLPILSQSIPLQGQIPVSQLPTQLAQLQSQLGQQQIKVQTVQLSQQSQELLRQIQAKIKSLLAIKTRTDVQQRNLQKLMDVQNKILLEGSIALQQQLQQTAKLHQHQHQQHQQSQPAQGGSVQVKQEPGVVVKSEPGFIKIEPGVGSSTGGIMTTTMPPTSQVATSQMLHPGASNMPVPNTQMQQPTPGPTLQVRQVGHSSTQQLPPQPASGAAGTTMTFTATATPAAGGSGKAGTPIKVASQIQIPIQVQEKLKAQLSKMTPEQQQEYIRQQLPVLIQLQQHAIRQQQQQQKQSTKQHAAKQHTAQKQQVTGGVTPQQQQQASTTGPVPVTLMPVQVPTVPAVPRPTLGQKPGQIPVPVQVAGKVILKTAPTSQVPAVQTPGTTAPAVAVTVKTVPKRPAITAASKSALFQRQLSQDQTQVLQPDLKTPFRSRKDAVMRLIRYHVFSSIEPPPDKVVQEEAQYEDQAQDLLERKDQMMNKYRLLLYDDAMRLEQTSEMVMLERMFIHDERERLKDEQKLVSEDPDSFAPCPMPESQTEESDDGHKEEDLPETSEPKKIKLEPVDEVEPITVKKEKIDDEAKMGSSPSYTLHSTGGLKIVIKNSPVHMKSPAHITDLTLTGADKFKPPRTKRDRGGSPRSTPLRSPVTSPLASPFRSPQYRSVGTPEQRPETVIKQEIDDTPMELGSSVEVDEEDGVFDGVVPFSDIKEEPDYRRETQSYEVPEHHRISDSLGYNSSSQDEGEASEADAAVAGLLSSTSMETDDELPPLLSPGQLQGRRRTSTTSHKHDTMADGRRGSYSHGAGHGMGEGESLDYVSGAGVMTPSTLEHEVEDAGGGEVTAAVDSLMDSLHDIRHDDGDDDVLMQQEQPSPQPEVQQYTHQPHNTYSFNQHQATDPQSHTTFDMSTEQAAYSESEDEDMGPAQSPSMNEFFGEAERPTTEGRSRQQEAQQGGRRKHEANDEEPEPTLNLEMQSAINSILSLQQTELPSEGDQGGGVGDTSAHQYASQSDSDRDMYDLYATGSGDISQETIDPMQDDLDAAVQSILM